LKVEKKNIEILRDQYQTLRQEDVALKVATRKRKEFKVIETMTLLILLKKYLKEKSPETRLVYLNMLKKSFSDQENCIEIP